LNSAFVLFLDQVVGEVWDMAYAALFGRCPTDLAVVLRIANTRYFSQEGATRPRRADLTCGKPTRITDEKSRDRHSHG